MVKWQAGNQSPSQGMRTALAAYSFKGFIAIDKHDISSLTFHHPPSASVPQVKKVET